MHTVLVPLDGSRFAESAAHTAAAVAERLDARLLLVTVLDPALALQWRRGSLLLGSPGGEDAHAAIQGYLDEARERIRGTRSLVVDTEVLDGTVADRVAEQAGRSGALVILASHGEGGMHRQWLGSVTDALVRRLDAPMLVVRPRGDVEAPGPAHASFKRVLVPLDAASPAEDVIDTAVLLAGTETAEYMLLASMPPLHPMLAAVASEAQRQKDTASQREIGETYLSAVADRLRARGLAVRTVVRIGLHAAQEILAAAGEEQADLIALSTHGRGPMDRVLLGSVADKVLRAATIPVLLQRIQRDASG